MRGALSAGLLGAIVSTFMPEPSTDVDGMSSSSPFSIGRIERGKSPAGSKPPRSASSIAFTAERNEKERVISSAVMNLAVIAARIQE